MAQYDIERELKKIQFAFQKVKQDYEHVLRRLHVVEKENITILNKLNKTKKVGSTTKIVKTVSDKVYIANKSSKKVHSQDCPYGKKINAQRREIFEKVSDALKQKYTRCSCVMS